jgi:hypothetical protein
LGGIKLRVANEKVKAVTATLGLGVGAELLVGDLQSGDSVFAEGILSPC